MSKPSLRTDPLRCVHVFPAGKADALARKTADKLHGTERRDWSYMILPPGSGARPVARVIPIAGNEATYKEAVELTLERVRATHELGEGPVASGIATILTTVKGHPVEHDVRVVEILLN